MSAECHECGLDIVYPEGTWPVGECPVCAPRERLLAFIESCRDLGRGALSADLPTAYREVALDTFDRQLDHIAGFVMGRA